METNIYHKTKIRNKIKRFNTINFEGIKTAATFSLSNKNSANITYVTKRTFLALLSVYTHVCATG